MTNHAVSNRADLRERTKTMSRHGDRRGQGPFSMSLLRVCLLAFFFVFFSELAHCKLNWASSEQGHRKRALIADFRGSFETINWLYLLFKCGIKTKTHFEWLLWHWSSLGQLNLEPTRPNGLVGCKVPTDLVKISVKEATHMGFYHRSQLTPCSRHDIDTPSSSLTGTGTLCRNLQWIPIMYDQ